MAKSGLDRGYGLGFWGPNGHDGIWHISLINSLARGSFDLPVFAGETIRNYHVGFDLLLALLTKISGFSASTLYFQIVPPILAVSIGLLTYIFVKSWQKSKIAALWATFFVYFAGGFGWITGLLRDGATGGESLFWSQQSISTLINPPFALSLVVFLSGLIALGRKRGIVAAVLFGILIQVKVYAGLLSLGGLTAVSVLEIAKKEKPKTLTIFIGTLVISLVLFLPFNNFSTFLVEWRPFWFLETMMAYSDRVGWPRFFSAMTNYRAGGNWLKGIPAYIVAFFIFWYGNMGMRLLGEFTFTRWLREKKFGKSEVMLSVIIVAGGLTPMFFIQKGTPWNTIQFFYYSLFSSSILAGVTVGKWQERLKIPKKNDKSPKKIYDILIYHNKIIMAVVLVMIIVPTSYLTLRNHYLPSRPPSMLPSGEIEALEFLSKQPDGIVLTYPFDKDKAKAAEDNPPRPLYLYESTAYVSAFSGQQVFLEDEVNLNITGYDWPARRAGAEEFYTSLDHERAREFLKENDIAYVYWVDGQRAALGESQLRLELLFENSRAKIFKVQL